MSFDLDETLVAQALAPRPVRAYPAALSTEALAAAWAREGVESGAVVVVDYQASPRGRGGLPWTVTAGRGLGFSMILRPPLPMEREGWPYVAASLAIAEVLGETETEWPDAVLPTGGLVPVARLGTYVEPGPGDAAWVTVTVLIENTRPPRTAQLSALVEAIVGRFDADPVEVLDEYRARCRTLGREVRARMIPMGADGPEINGEAVDVLDDGALVIRTAKGSRVAVPPQNLGLLEDPETPAEVPPEVRRRLDSPSASGSGPI